MNLGLRIVAGVLASGIFELACPTHTRADEFGTDNQLTLADLAVYRTALSGKPTADGTNRAEPPRQVHFQDLWERPDSWRGRCVTVQGRVERIFRQGPVGSFPALAEAWIASPAGNPFCLVFPQERASGRSSMADQSSEGGVAPPAIPAPGQTVQFTGIFLKMVRYSARDGARLAPLVVGDRFPAPVSERGEAKGGESRSARPGDVFRAIGGGHPDGSLKRWHWSAASWELGLALAALAAGVLAWQHLRRPSRQTGSRYGSRRRPAPVVPDPPLEFLDPGNEA
jgi:hypothetical protein